MDNYLATLGDVGRLRSAVATYIVDISESSADMLQKVLANHQNTQINLANNVYKYIPGNALRT